MKQIVDAVEKYRDFIIQAEKYLWQHPETGYKEVETTKYLAREFERLGYTLRYAEGIPGFYTDIDTGKDGPCVLILAELDAVICPTHKAANPVTGAVHACGHHAQCATILGVAAVLKERDILSDLCGKIRLCLVPAEELLEIEYRTKLKQEGKIKYFGGKCEFLSRGYFDGVDLAFMIHPYTETAIRCGHVGFIAKNIIFKGKAVHAGGKPWDGKNALYAANCALNATNALRETFQEKDLIRWHPIITCGGDMVNAIPETVTMESQVRGANMQAIRSANKKINRAIVGAALSIGVNVEIIDSYGYSAFKNDKAFIEVAKQTYETLFPDKKFTVSDRISTGCTDMGDLAAIMPVIHPYIAGTKGTGHGNDFEIFDIQSACIDNAKWQILTAITLLKDGAEKAKKIVKNYKPAFSTKEEFLAYKDSFNDSGDRIVYESDVARARID